MTDEKIKDILRAADFAARAEQLHSKYVPIPDDPAAWLDEVVQYAAHLPDEIPQKEYLQRYAQIAKAALADGDDTTFRRFMLKISRQYDDAPFNEMRMRVRDRSIKEKVGGVKGGSKNKRREWAELMADELAGNGYTENQAWNAVPDSDHAFEAETDKAEYRVYADGEKIVALDVNTQDEQTLTRSTFIKNYYRPARKNRNG